MDVSHRKVKKLIRLTDSGGASLSNAEVRVQQTNHKFLFGCGAFDFIPYVMNGDEEHREITDSWLEIFNYGTLPFYF